MSSSVVEDAVELEGTEDDVFQLAVEYVESVDDAAEAINRGRTYLDKVDGGYFWLGASLHALLKKKLWEGSGYGSFAELVDAEYGFQKRKAYYLISTYEGLVNADVPWSDVKHLGWTKLRELAPILTADNAAELIGLAEGMNCAELQAYVASLKAGSLDKNEYAEDEGPKQISKTFKFHADQWETVELALEKARGEADTEYDAVALEAVCLGYLSGPKAPKPAKPPSLRSLIKEVGIDDALAAVGDVFPEADITYEV